MDMKDILVKGMANMMKRKSFKNITVQMILDECKVSRSTFYKYYRDKYDIMNDYFKREADEIFNDVDTMGLEAVYARILSFERNNLTFFQHAIKVEGDNSFWEFMYDYSYKFLSKNVDKDDEFKQILLIQTIAGQLQVIKNWIEKGCQMEPEVLARYLFLLTPEEFY